MGGDHGLRGRMHMVRQLGIPVVWSCYAIPLYELVCNFQNSRLPTSASSFARLFSYSVRWWW